MLDNDIISKTEMFLKDKLDSGIYLSSHPKDKTYRLEHSYRVANIGRNIAKAEGFDETEMTVACLLHDISYCEEFGENGWKDHGRRSAAITRPFLKELGFRGDRLEDICYGIAIHVDDEADFPGIRTPFALTIGDADNLDRFDIYRIHETLASAGFLHMTIAEKTEYVSERLNKLNTLTSVTMGTNTATEIWKERIGFYIEFIKKLSNQLESSISIKN